MHFSFTGLLLALLWAVPGAFFAFAFPPHAVPEGLQKPPAGRVWLKRIGDAGVLAALLFSGAHFQRPFDAFFYAAMVAFALDIALWVRYLVKKRAYRYLYASLLFIPVPRTFAQGMGVLLVALWGRYLLLGVFALIMMAGQALVSLFCRKNALK